MPKAKASIELPGQVSAAEALWYDVVRWPAFVDGFHHVERQEGDWPREGARMRWTSTPDGRGLVEERVTHYEVRSGQTVRVEDPRILGTQTVKFTPKPEGASELTIELDFRIKNLNPVASFFSGLFIRRAFNDMLRRTLGRFRHELRGDVELEHER
jgi:Polyketide cyclase / dehydrase and lipid transport